MRARKYNKKIEVWQTTPVSDGFGGNGVTTSLLASSWCKIITDSKSKVDDEAGESTTYETIVLQLRKRNDVTYLSDNQFFKYRGFVYTIKSAPVNVGFDDREIQIILQRDSNG